MLLLRTIALLIALSAVVATGAWVLTGDRKWLGWALRALRLGVLVGLVFFGILILERIV